LLSVGDVNQKQSAKILISIQSIKFSDIDFYWFSVAAWSTKPQVTNGLNFRTEHSSITMITLLFHHIPLLLGLTVQNTIKLIQNYNEF